MKNILNVVTSINPQNGGVSESIRNFEVGFSIINNKYIGEIHVLCLDESDDVLKWDNKGLIVHAMGKVSNPWKYHKEMYSWLITNYNIYEVIIVHGIWLYHSYAVFKLITFLKKYNLNPPQLLIMPHGMLDPWFQNDKTRRFKALRNDIYWRFIENKVINNADGLLYTCEQEKKMASIPFPNYKPKNEYVVGLGIKPPPDLNKNMINIFLNNYPSLKGNSYILFLGRIDYKKGLTILLESYKYILLNSTKSTMSFPMLVIAGPGLDKYYGKSIFNIVNSNKLLASKIVFTGMISGDEKWGAFYGCEAFILPSHQENFGIAVVEAMACKKPVLISNQVNIWKEIENGQGGIIAADTESGVKQQLMAWLSLSDEKKAVMGQNAYLTYKKYFSVEEAANKLASVLLETA